MVNTRRKNAKEDTNPGKPVFSKEQNDLFIQQVHEKSLHATDQYSLNKFVLGFNESSTEADMKTSYCSMARRFHPDKNIGLDTSKMMTMINEAKDGLENTLRTNDSSREEERVCAAKDAITLFSDENYDSETSETSSEPATSSNKASTFTAEHSTDNEETPLKKTHPLSWTSKKRSFINNQKVIFRVWRRFKL